MHWKVDPSRPMLSAHLEEIGLNPKACDQNGACSAACPLGSSFDYLPHQVLRLVQLEAHQRLFRSSAIWLCSDCSACTAACPQSVDVAGIFRNLRRLAHQQHETPSPEVEGVKASHDAFLGELQSSGRISDARVATSYKLRSGDVFTDLPLSAKLWGSGGISFSQKGGGKGGPEAVDLALTRERQALHAREDRYELAQKVEKEQAEKEKAERAKEATDRSGEAK
jgi:heterodisulfide reductase subunit C